MNPYGYRASELGYSSKAEKKAMREAIREAKLARRSMLDAASRTSTAGTRQETRGRLRRVLSGAFAFARFGYLIFAH